MPTPTEVTTPTESVSVVDGGKAVLVAKGERTRRIPARWARLLASDDTTIDPSNGQRRFDSMALPPEVRVRSATAIEDEGVWELRFDGGTARVHVEVERLLGVASGADILGPDREAFSSADPLVRSVDAEALHAPAALRSFLETLFRRGYGRVRGFDATPDALAAFGRRIGRAKATRRIEPQEFIVRGRDDDDGAATSCAPKTDGAFRNPVPSFFAFLCLEDNLKGGDAVLVDGLSAAMTLAIEDPMAAAELARTPMLFARKTDRLDLRASAPILETGADSGLRQIRFDDRAAVDFIGSDARLEECARAYELLSQILLREGVQHRISLRPGDLLLVDNERILQGWTPFQSAGERRLACCHFDRGELLSTWRRARSGELE